VLFWTLLLDLLWIYVAFNDGDFRFRGEDLLSTVKSAWHGNKQENAGMWK